LRIENWGTDLKDKADATEIDIEAASIRGEHLIALPNGKAVVVDSSSKRMRVIKSHE
jgi:hypothetical protein